MPWADYFLLAGSVNIALCGLVLSTPNASDLAPLQENPILLGVRRVQAQTHK